MSETVMRIAGESEKSLPKKINFTVAALKGVQIAPDAPGDRVWVYDVKVPHLAFMRTKSGASAFYWVGRNQGRAVRHRLGDGAISVEAARNLANATTTDNANKVDLIAAKRAARKSTTFKGVFDDFVRNAKLHGKKTWMEDEEKYKNHLQAWGSRPVKSITWEDVRALHLKIGEDRPGAANRVLALVSAVFNAAKLPNPAKGVKRFPEKKRTRALLPDELPRFFAALKKAPADWRDVFELALLTGARAGNLLAMEWAELDLKSGVWSISAAKMKSGESLQIPLHEEAVQILNRRLKALPARNAGEDLPRYVFPGRQGSKTGHIVEYKNAWADLCEAGKLVDLRFHDLRHTHATYMATTGANISAIGRALGHMELETTKRYINLELAPVRDAQRKAIDAIQKLRTVKVKQK